VKSCGTCGVLHRGGALRKPKEKKEFVPWKAPKKEKEISVREVRKLMATTDAKRHMRTDHDALEYAEKPITNIFRKRRKWTVEEIGIFEAKACGAGRFNYDRF